MSRVLFVLLLAPTAGALGCAKPGSPVVSEPEFYARNVKAYAETTKGLPPEIVYGWDLTLTRELARWRECAAADSCSRTERSRPTSELLGVEHASEIELDGEKVEVLKLSLTPRPTWVVPNFKPAR